MTQRFPISIIHFCSILLTILFFLVITPTAVSASADFDNNNRVDYQDMRLFIQNKLDQHLIFDVTGNGIVDIFDFNSIIRLLLKPTNTATPTLGTSPIPTTPPIAGLKTKKWNPGHYLQLGNSATPDQLNSSLNESGASGMKGARIYLYWDEFEPQKDAYNRVKLDQYLAKVPPNKKLIIFLWERDYWGSTCGTSERTARLPSYIRNHPTNPALSISGGCVAQTWKPDIQDRWIKAVSKIGEYIDNDNRVEAIMFPESSFGVPEGYENSESLLRTEIENGLIIIHKGIAPKFQKTHVFQQMNWIGGRTCTKLDNVAEELRTLGHAISNPDSPPWRGMPFGCTPSSPYDYAGLLPGDGPVPIFSTYRKFKNTLPILAGGDTSQYEDPERPRTFNGKKMDYTNLVEQLYLSAVKGYIYTPANPDLNVSSYGANYMLWTTGYNSITAQRQFPNNPIPTSTYTSRFKAAYFALVNNPAKATNTTCPTNIRCL
jgi:hypothetical protein